MPSTSTRQRIAILLPMLDAIRNIVYAGVLENLLQSGVEVHLLFYNFHPTLRVPVAHENFSTEANCHPLIIPTIRHKIKGLSLLKEVIGSAFSRRNKIGSYALYRRWYDRQLSGIARLRRDFVELLGFFVQPAPLFYNLYHLYNYFYKLEYDLKPIQQQLEKLRPHLLLSTVNVETTYERAYVLAAKKLGLPVVNSVLSFDNLTSKPAHLLYDYYLLWNQGMHEQLLRFYSQIRSTQVYVTGTPQFDFHFRTDCHWKREDTLVRLGLPPDAKYFLYGASPKTLTPAEPELVALFIKKMQKDDVLRDYWLVVRMHPRDEWERWETVCRGSGRLLLSRSVGADSPSGRAVFPTRADQALLISSLSHSTACINIASTITFDAAILDRPIIGLRFDKEPDAPRENIYEEYDTDHYRPLVESGGLQIAHDWSEMMGLMRQAIQDPARHCFARSRMVAQECGLVDGKAAQRVADALLDILKKINASS